MLNRPVDRIVYDAEGRACGVISQGEYAKCKSIVADPSYFATSEPAKVKRTSTVVRAIAILSHPITDSKDESCQIIIPQKQVGRRSDIYVFLAGSSFNICPAGKYLAFVSTTSPRASSCWVRLTISCLINTTCWSPPALASSMDALFPRAMMRRHTSRRHLRTAWTSTAASLARRLT